MFSVNLIILSKNNNNQIIQKKIKEKLYIYIV